MAKKKKSKKKKKALTKIFGLIIGLIILFLLLCFITPTESEEKLKSSGLIENLEIPALINGEEVITHTGYTLSYNEEYELPSWVAYELTREEVTTIAVERNDNFREDESVTTGSATLSDYRKSGYDRGHMAPAADFRWSAESMNDTFYLSNMCPQTHSFNAGIWSDLESAVRSIAYEDEVIYVVTGPVLTDGPYKTIGQNNVAVPNYFYKVILDYKDPVIKAIGFILPHENSKESLSYFAVTVDEVEEITGIDFFPSLPDEIEEVVESSVDPSLWALRNYSPSASSINKEALEYTSNSTINNKDEMKIINAFNSLFLELKKEVFSYLGLTKEARKLGLI